MSTTGLCPGITRKAKDRNGNMDGLIEIGADYSNLVGNNK